MSKNDCVGTIYGDRQGSSIFKSPHSQTRDKNVDEAKNKLLWEINDCQPVWVFCVFKVILCAYPKPGQTCVSYFFLLVGLIFCLEVLKWKIWKSERCGWNEAMLINVIFQITEKQGIEHFSFFFMLKIKLKTTKTSNVYKNKLRGF